MCCFTMVAVLIWYNINDMLPWLFAVHISYNMLVCLERWADTVGETVVVDEMLVTALEMGVVVTVVTIRDRG